MQLGLDVAGVTGDAFAGAGAIADGTNAAISLGRAFKEPERRKEHLFNAGISVVSMVPFIGDTAKLLKAKGARRTVQKAISVGKAKRRRNLSSSRSDSRSDSRTSETAEQVSPASSTDDHQVPKFDSTPWTGDSINDFIESVKSGKSLTVQRGKEPSLPDLQRQSSSGADAARTFAEHHGAYNSETEEVDTFKIAEVMQLMTKQQKASSENRAGGTRTKPIGSPADTPGGAPGDIPRDTPEGSGERHRHRNRESDTEEAAGAIDSVSRFVGSLVKKLSPLGVVVGTIGVAAGSAVAGFVKLTSTLSGMNQKTLELNRDLAEYNGSLAATYARSEVRDIQRSRREGQTMEGSMARLGAAQSDLKDEMSKMTTPLNALNANVQAKMTEMLVHFSQMFPIMETIGIVAEKINTWIGINIGGGTSAGFNSFFQDVSDGKFDGRRPHFHFLNAFQGQQILPQKDHDQVFGP
ncbi:MAG: hypothetical protein ACF788_03975 [Novipirellula sp. JB048]